jgi:hypothetical protein
MSEWKAYTTLSKKCLTLFFPAVSNGDRAGKLSIVVVGLSCACVIFCCLATPLDASVAAR